MMTHQHCTLTFWYDTGVRKHVVLPYTDKWELRFPFDPKLYREEQEYQRLQEELATTIQKIADLPPKRWLVRKIYTWIYELCLLQIHCVQKSKLVILNRILKDPSIRKQSLVEIYIDEDWRTLPPEKQYDILSCWQRCLKGDSSRIYLNFS